MSVPSSNLSHLKVFYVSPFERIDILKKPKSARQLFPEGKATSSTAMTILQTKGNLSAERTQSTLLQATHRAKSLKRSGRQIHASKKLSDEEKLKLKDTIEKWGLDWTRLAKEFPGRELAQIKKTYYRLRKMDTSKPCPCEIKIIERETGLNQGRPRQQLNYKQIARQINHELRNYFLQRQSGFVEEVFLKLKGEIEQKQQNSKNCEECEHLLWRRRQAFETKKDMVFRTPSSSTKLLPLNPLPIKLEISSERI